MSFFEILKDFLYRLGLGLGLHFFVKIQYHQGLDCSQSISAVGKCFREEGSHLIEVEFGGQSCWINSV